MGPCMQRIFIPEPGSKTNPTTTSSRTSTMSFSMTRSDQDNDTDRQANSKLHPGEYGRVEAWLNRTKLDLELARDQYGCNPAVVFQPRAPMYKMTPAIEAPAGRTAADSGTGEAWIRRTDGTPSKKRAINFTPSVNIEDVENMNQD